MGCLLFFNPVQLKQHSNAKRDLLFTELDCRPWEKSVTFKTLWRSYCCLLFAVGNHLCLAVL